MKITVNSQLLAAELRLLCKVVPTKPAVAIFGHVLLRATDALSLYATDHEIGLLTLCQASVHVPGVVALPAFKLLAMVEQFPDADVVIAKEDAHIFVRCGAFTSRMQVIDASEFPSVPMVHGDASTIDAEALRQLIAKTRYAVSATAAKYILQGALLTLAGQAGSMVATDGKRLAMAMTGRTGADARVIVIAKTLDLIAGQSYVGEATLSVSKQHLFFAFGNRLLISRTLDGEFPRYDRIVPKDNDKIVRVDRTALSAALRRVCLAAEDNKAVYFSINTASIELASQSVEVGFANEALPATYDGPPLKICVNGTYVLDFLDVATEQIVTMALKDDKGAMLLSDGDDHIAVVMMMRQ